MRDAAHAGRLFAVAIAAAGLGIWSLSRWAIAADPGAPLTSNMKRGEVSIVAEPVRVNGELILKVVALNHGPAAAALGPEDVSITTADGKPVAVMSLAELIAQAKSAAGVSAGSQDNMPGQSGPVVTRNLAGQPNINNYAGGTSLSGTVGNSSDEESAGGPTLAAQIASLKAGILQDVTVAPGEVKGGEVVTQPIRFHWREKHTLRITVRFSGEQHEFELQAPPEQ